MIEKHQILIVNLMISWLLIDHTRSVCIDLGQTMLVVEFALTFNGNMLYYTIHFMHSTGGGGGGGISWYWNYFPFSIHSVCFTCLHFFFILWPCCFFSCFISIFIHSVCFSSISHIYFYDDSYRTLLKRIKEKNLYGMEHHKKR